MPETLNDQELIEVIEDDGKGLNTWEAEFIESMLIRIHQGGTLTPTMRTKAEQIYNERVPSRARRNNMKIVVVLSGGMDSTTLLYHLRDARHEVVALSVNYGQRHVKELVAAVDTCERLGVHCEIADLSGLRPMLAGSALTSFDIAVPEGHYADPSMKATVVPNRNMLLISVALAWCVALDYDGVAYAAHAGDHAVYPDCRTVFAEALGVAARLCDYRERELMRPFVSWTKADIVRRGSVLGVPFEATWSCYKGGGLHCGKCGTCVERIEAFAIAGVTDLTAYEGIGECPACGHPDCPPCVAYDATEGAP